MPSSACKKNAGDPVLYGNLPPREISMKYVFRSGDSSKKFNIAEGQCYRYAPSYVSPAYHLLEGFPFIQEPPSGDLQERVLIRHFFFNDTATTEIYTLSLHDALPSSPT